MTGEKILTSDKKNRIELLDGLRGLAVVLMVLHHFLYDLTEFAGLPKYFFTNPVFDVLHYIFASVFVIICGISSDFSRSNIKRGLKTTVAALIISAVTIAMDTPIIFGVLHMLAFCMLFYGITQRLWEKIPGIPLMIGCIVFGVLSVVLLNTVETDSHYLWIFGWDYSGFVSYDYFPLFPWLFIFMFGTVLGRYIRDNRFPDWFYRAKMPVFSTVGRYSLIIYMVHQPVLYGITMIIKLFV
ncbi:MAG: DUF1624 domain-containing protein [Clostridiales bacterium]|nr:DUF1624 domain-containing protein [Clostridiales bacterium]